jgi:hypothetical protein
MMVQAEPQVLLVSSWIMNPVCSPHPDGKGPALVFMFDTTTLPFRVIESKYMQGWLFRQDVSPDTRCTAMLRRLNAVDEIV